MEVGGGGGGGRGGGVGRGDLVDGRGTYWAEGGGGDLLGGLELMGVGGGLIGRVGEHNGRSGGGGTYWGGGGGGGDLLGGGSGWGSGR